MEILKCTTQNFFGVQFQKFKYKTKQYVETKQSNMVEKF